VKTRTRRILRAKIPVVMILGFDWVDRSRGRPALLLLLTTRQEEMMLSDDEPMMNAEKKELGHGCEAALLRRLS